MDFNTLKKKIIKKDFSRMNEMQFQAVTTTEGAVLVLAGAGSGKTTVLVNRIAYLVKYGNAFLDDDMRTPSDAEMQQGLNYLEGKAEHPGFAFTSNPVRPYNILAITFTNKAAGELKNRIANILGGETDVWAGTFHSICAKILRISGGRLGYSSSFTIYDEQDQKRVVKDILKQKGIGEKELSPKLILGEISRAKESFLTPEEYLSSAAFNYSRKKIAEVFAEYNEKLKQADAMDFDDLISNTVRLLEENPDILEKFASRFHYVMVDEYQDTNHAQFKLVSLLSSVHKNICVVGDDDQSIYSFRGATIENILNFEHQFKDAIVIRLEQNYRSTKTILKAANALIANNRGRKGKELWTDLEEDNIISVTTSDSAEGEGRYIAGRISDAVAAGKRFSDHAILYRMNAQSAAIENVLTRSGIPYRVIGGHRFFDRKEIKDVISYLAVINNTKDSVRLKRIINEPKRGIGDTSIAKAEQIADSLNLSLFEVLKTAEDYPSLSRVAAKAKEFCTIIEDLQSAAQTLTIDKLFELTLDVSGYMDMLKREGLTGKDRVENVNELLTSILQYMKDNEGASLEGFLEEVALISDIDNFDNESDTVTLMTLHSAKGLEFNTVFLVGLEEEIFPGTQSIYGGEAEMEEERRLMYVGITRAKRKLYITNAYTRMLFGQTRRGRPSRFIKELPEDCLEVKGYSPFNAQSTSGYSSGYGGSFSGYSGGYGYAAKEYSGFNDYSVPKTTTTVKPVERKTMNAGKTYKVGSAVRHKAFGEGIILNTTPMGNDTLLEIAFTTAGTKRVMANFARLEEIN